MGAAGAAAGGIAAAGVAGAAGNVVAGGEASKGAQAAANTQAQAMARQQAMAQPFVNLGQATGNELLAEIQGGVLGQPAPTTTADIAQMPGYQFTLQQGLLSTQNAAAARGLGVSGAALMGAANYATGLAQSNYQNYFSDYWANQMNRYNMLAGMTGVGANAAVGAGSNIGQTAAAQGIAQTAAGQAQAAGTSGATNSLANSLLASALQLRPGGSTITPATDPNAATDWQAPQGVPGSAYATTAGL